METALSRNPDKAWSTEALIGCVGSGSGGAGRTGEIGEDYVVVRTVANTQIRIEGHSCGNAVAGGQRGNSRGVWNGGTVQASSVEVSSYDDHCRGKAAAGVSCSNPMQFSNADTLSFGWQRDRSYTSKEYRRDI